MKLPEHLFFTGVPGSHWSAIAQDIENIPGFNTSDHSDQREYSPGTYTGHKGAYFGESMEFKSFLNLSYINTAWKETGGTKIVKSHEWAYKLPLIKQLCPDAWIMLVYRPDLTSYAWWHEAGGFKIKYPNYDSYKDSTTMLSEITRQNQAILDFGCVSDAKWSHYSTQWLQDTFECDAVAKKQKSDILVTVIK